MKKVQEQVKKIVRILPPMALDKPPSFSSFYFTLLQGLSIYFGGTHSVIGTYFAHSKAEKALNINKLWLL